jgi:hypothetical protein
MHKDKERANFAKRVLGEAEKFEGKPFEPIVAYDRDGDYLEFIAEPAGFRAERIDDLVTVYYSHETGEIIGSVLKDFSKFCEKVLAESPGIRVVVHDGRVRLEHLFLARVLSADEPFPDVTYQRLIEIAQRTKAEADLVSV